MSESPLQFDVDFEGANGANLRANGDGRFSFEIRPDTHSDDRQWFYFRVRGGKGTRLTARMADAGSTNIPGHWNTSRPVVSHDGGLSWSRVNEHHNDLESGVFSFSFDAESDATLVAMHYPLTWSDAKGRIAEWSGHPHVCADVIGKSVEGRAIDRLTIIDPSSRAKNKRLIWLTARQHAAESSGSFAFEGMMDFILSDAPAAVALRANSIIHTVPMINPDGVVHGNYRDNALGVNLNRVWNNPNAETSPEILHVTNAIRESARDGSFDFFIDFHSDSCAHEHYAFHASPASRVKGDAAKYYRDSVRFLHFAGANCPDFLPGKGVTGKHNTGISYHYIREEYGALAFIPEAGYSDVSHGENAGSWLDPDRHRAVGRAFGLALAKWYE